MADGTLRDPLLAQHKQQHKHKQQRRAIERTESIAGRVLTASSAISGRGFAWRRTPARRQSTTVGRDWYAFVSDHASVSSILSRLASPFVQFYKRFIEELKFFSLPAKAGLAAAICSVLCFVPGPLSFLNKNGMWAVITADNCFGPNVGLTLYKGLNRTLGTLAAVALAFLIDFVAPLCGPFEPYFVIFWTFLGAALPTMFKFRRPFKDRWNYAVVMSMITLHILILSKSDFKDKIKLPMIRMVTILVGFCTASLVSLCVAPVYVGDVINELVAKNLERAGDVMERCVYAYCDGAVLEQVQDIRAGKSEDDNIHTSFHEVLVADAEVVRLLQAVPYEPCHGKFFLGYPWHMYRAITDILRQSLYDVAALDSCLRAEIQAPRHIRHIFEEDFQCVGKECAQVFRMIGQSIRQMRHVHCLHRLQRAEEGALLLQHNISKYMSSELDGNTADGIGRQSKEAREAQDAYEERISIYFRDACDDQLFSSPEGYFGTQMPPAERSDNSSSTDAVKCRRQHLADKHQDLLRRRKSMNRRWNTTIHRISVLSLIKFASILAELVAKAKFVARIAGELEIQARFAENEEGNFAK